MVDQWEGVRSWVIDLRQFSYFSREVGAAVLGLEAHLKSPFSIKGLWHRALLPAANAGLVPR